MPKVSELGECPLCFGRLLPLSVCQSCDTVAALAGLEEVGPEIACEDCGATNPTHFVCSACNARFPYRDVLKPEGPVCPICRSPVPARAEACPNCDAILAPAGTRGPSKRRIRGEYTEEDVRELGRIPGVGTERAEALCAAGYSALWKVARASEAELARIRGIGPPGAAEIQAGLRTLRVVGRPKSKEEVLTEEWACPLCGTITSLFSTQCHDCGAQFDEEEVDAEFRKEVGQGEDRGLLAYYDVRLLEQPGDIELHYARAVLLLSIRRIPEALASLDRVLELRPGDARALQAKIQALASAKGVGAAAQVLREVASGAAPSLPPPTPVPPPRPPERARQAPAQSKPPPKAPEPGEEARLLDELERAVQGSEALPPPPLKPVVPEEVVERKRALLTFFLHVPGVGRPAAEAMSGFFADLEQVALVDEEQLAAIPGVSPAEARLMLEAVLKRTRGRVEAPPAREAPRPAPPLPSVEEFVEQKRALLAFFVRVPGVSRHAAEAMSSFFADLDQVDMADVEQLAALPGVSPVEARLALEAALTRSRGSGEAPPAREEPAAPPPPPAPRVEHVAEEVPRPPRSAEAPRERVRPTEAPPIPRAVARPPRVLRRPPAPAAATRAPLVSVAGRRGLINGRGLVNGRGRINGLINGTGFVNGSAIAEPRLPRRSLTPRYLAIGGALLMLFAIAATLVEPMESPGTMVVDGDVRDWSGAPTFADGTAVADANLAIQRTSVRYDAAEGFLYAWVRVNGTAFGGTRYATLYLFLDADGRNTTGYALPPIGADYLARVSGSGGKAEETKLLRFSGTDAGDWSGWRADGPVSAAAKDGDVEIGVPMDSMVSFNPQGFRALFAFEDDAGSESRTQVPVGAGSAALRVTQDLGPDVTTSRAVGTGPGQRLLRVTFHALGVGDVHVTQAVLGTDTNGTYGSIRAIAVPSGGDSVVDVAVDTTGLPAGAVVAASVVSVQADAPVAIVGTGARAYAGAPLAAQKRIDGLFADWPNPIADGQDVPAVRRGSLDLQAQDAAVVGGEVFLYAKLAGLPLEGSSVPERLLRPQPSGGGGNGSAPALPPPPQRGFDYIRFYVQTNESSPGGFVANGLAVDRYVEVLGREGEVANGSAYRWTPSGWEWNSSLAVGLGAREIEIGAVMPGAASNRTHVVAMTADWSGVADVADAVTTRGGTRGDPILVPWSDPPGLQTAVAKALDNTPTVDGNCDTGGAGEYSGAVKYQATGFAFYVGRVPSADKAYVCIDFTVDTTSDSGDFGELVFDRGHDGGQTPETDDRRFNVTVGGSLASERGGSGWTACDGACYQPEGVGSFNASAHIVYEFGISFWDVWGDNATLPNQIAGFAIQVHDAGTGDDYTWGSSQVNDDVPDTWGHLEIPEFPSVLAVGAAVVLVLLVRRRRRP